MLSINTFGGEIFFFLCFQFFIQLIFLENFSTQNTKIVFIRKKNLKTFQEIRRGRDFVFKNQKIEKENDNNDNQEKEYKEFENNVDNKNENENENKNENENENVDVNVNENVNENENELKNEKENEFMQLCHADNEILKIHFLSLFVWGTYRIFVLTMSCYCAMLHRRHLMVWAIFAPKVSTYVPLSFSNIF